MAPLKLCHPRSMPTWTGHLPTWTWTRVCRKKIICLVKQSSSMERTNAWGDMWSPYDGINISWLASKVPQFFFLWIPQNFVHNSTRGMQSQNREYYQTIVTSHQALWQLRNFWLQRMRVISSSQIILSTRPCDTRWAYTCTQAVLALFLCVCAATAHCLAFGYKQRPRYHQTPCSLGLCRCMPRTEASHTWLLPKQCGTCWVKENITCTSHAATLLAITNLAMQKFFFCYSALIDSTCFQQILCPTLPETTGSTVI